MHRKKGEEGFRAIAEDYALLRHQVMKQIDDEVVKNFEALLMLLSNVVDY